MTDDETKRRVQRVEAIPVAAQQEREARVAIELHTLTQRHKTLREVWKWGVLGWVGLQFIQTMGDVAGTSTIWNFVAKVDVSDSVYQILTLILGGVTMVQRKVHKSYIEKNNERVRLLESKADPGRSSSQLTLRGDNKPEDEP